jgi:tetratricopeptide (TPR) repeat protein
MFATRFRWLLLLALLSCRHPMFAGPAPGQTSYIDGLDALESKKWSDAAKAFSQALDADEENADYFLARGVTNLMANEMKLAGADFDRSYRLNKSNDTTQLWYAAYLRMVDDATAAGRVRSPVDYRGTIQEAGEQLHQALKYDRKSPADKQALRDRFEDFGVQFAKGIKAARPELAASLMNRMKAEFNAGKFPATLKDLGPLMQAEPHNGDLLYYHAVCLRNLGNLPAAREELTRVLSTWSNHSASYSERAIAEAQLGNVKRARADLALAAKYNPTDAKQMTPIVEKELAAYKIDPGDRFRG